jgi:hypothetical protein
MNLAPATRRREGEEESGLKCQEFERDIPQRLKRGVPQNIKDQEEIPGRDPPWNLGLPGCDAPHKMEYEGVFGKPSTAQLLDSNRNS